MMKRVLLPFIILVDCVVILLGLTVIDTLARYLPLLVDIAVVLVLLLVALLIRDRRRRRPKPVDNSRLEH